jgi:cyclophilin family peptidyl-prolyl cis-trans isomerase
MAHQWTVIPVVSQFFICHNQEATRNTWTATIPVFGKVTEGIEVLDQIRPGRYNRKDNGKRS